MKALEDRYAVATPNGRVAIGWLTVEDRVMVLTLVLLPALAEVLGGRSIAASHPTGGNLGLLASFGLTLLKVSSLVALVLLVGPRVMPWLLRQVARTGGLPYLKFIPDLIR